MNAVAAMGASHASEGRDPIRVTVGIKALNEEARIADAIVSALDGTRVLGGEVIVSDSGSTDRTVEIARDYPVRVVQLANRGDRSCGAGGQLAYQFARGDYFYMLDGDMKLAPDFLERGVAFLEANPDYAAVGGRVVERNVEGEEFQIRDNTTRNDRNWLPGEVDRLDCGGLYRMSALRDVDYFTDRNLHAFEEFELGARLRSRRWKLARIDADAVDHFGHAMGGYSLLLRRMKSGYSGAPGEVLRGAVGRRHMRIVLTGFGHVRNSMVIILWWFMLLYMLFAGRPLAFSILIAAPILFLAYRRRSLRLGLYSFTAWNVSALGLISGFFRRRVPPTLPLAAVELTRGEARREVSAG